MLPLHKAVAVRISKFVINGPNARLAQFQFDSKGNYEKAGVLRTCLCQS